MVDSCVDCCSNQVCQSKAVAWLCRCQDAMVGIGQQYGSYKKDAAKAGRPWRQDINSYGLLPSQLPELLFDVIPHYALSAENSGFT